MIDLKVLLTTVAAIVLAELGDKTQLTAIALSSCNRPTKVFLGCFSGFFVVNLLTVLFGDLLKIALPLLLVKIFSALALFIFGVLMLKEKEKFVLKKNNHGILSSFILVSSMELGDKTNLAVLALATYFQETLEVILGIFVASALLMGLAIALGSIASKLVSLDKLRIASAIFFLIMATLIILGIIFHL